MHLSSGARIVMLGIACALAGVLRAADSAPTAAIEGKVAEAASGASLAGVTVELENRRAPVDANGRFVLKDIPVGTHLLVVSAPGHARIEKTVELVPGDNRLPTYEL